MNKNDVIDRATKAERWHRDRRLQLMNAGLRPPKKRYDIWGRDIEIGGVRLNSLETLRRWARHWNNEPPEYKRLESGEIFCEVCGTTFQGRHHRSLSQESAA